MAVSREIFKDSVFAGLPPAVLEQVTEAALIWRFIPGDVFFRQGDSPLGLFCIKDGQVKLYRQFSEKSHILAILSAGDTFGADSLSTQAPCTAFAEAISPGMALYIPCDRLERLMREYPDVSLLMLRIVSEQLKHFAHLLHSFAFQDVSTRLAEVLLKQAVLQNKTPNANQLSVDRVLSQQDLAAMVGTAREVIYRTLKKFEHEGLIKLTPSQIIILDVARFQAFANQEIW